MVQVAVVKDFKFNFDKNFNNFDKNKIIKQISQKVELQSIDSTEKLFEVVHTVLLSDDNSEKKLVAVTNCYYDAHTVVQSFSSDSNDVNNFVFVKRKIVDSDTYTFSLSDSYEYMDMSIDLVAKIIRNRYISGGVMVGTDGIVKNIEYTNNIEPEYLCQISCMDSDNKLSNISYLNLPRVISDEKDNREDVANKFLSENKNIQYIYGQIQTPFGILNCWYSTSGEDKNEMMSRLLDVPIFGCAIVGLENYHNNTDSIIDIDKELFIKILTALSDKSSKKQIKNTNFYNIYYEFG
jgi:hypothetical protein